MKALFLKCQSETNHLVLPVLLYFEPQGRVNNSQTSKMKRFPRIDNRGEAVNYFAKCPILDVWQGSEQTSEPAPPAKIFEKIVDNLE